MLRGSNSCSCQVAAQLLQSVTVDNTRRNVEGVTKQIASESFEGDHVESAGFPLSGAVPLIGWSDSGGFR